MQDALPIVIVAVVVAAGLIGFVTLLVSRKPYDRIGRSDLSFDHDATEADTESTREEEIAQLRAAAAARRADRERRLLG